MLRVVAEAKLKETAKGFRFTEGVFIVRHSYPLNPKPSTLKPSNLTRDLC